MHLRRFEDEIYVFCFKEFESESEEI